MLVHGYVVSRIARPSPGRGSDADFLGMAKIQTVEQRGRPRRHVAEPREGLTLSMSRKAGLPAMVAIVLVMVVPGVESVRRRRDTAVAIGAIALVVVLSFTLGTQQHRLLTCGDFKISGNDQPAGCTPGTGVLGS